MKKAMILRGVEIQDYCTAPFVKANEEQTVKIKSLTENIKLI